MACRTTAINGGYVGNNPVNWVDPWGLSPIDEQKNGLTRDQILDTIQTAKKRLQIFPVRQKENDLLKEKTIKILQED